MTAIKILTVIFIAFASSRAFLRFKDKALSRGGVIFWLTLWAATLVLVFVPTISDKIAGALGLSRGVDSIFFIAIILNFYLVFRLYIKIDQVDKDLTDASVNLSKYMHRLAKKEMHDEPEFK